MKLNLKKNAVALVVLAATISPLANAGMGELAALMKSPIGRFILMETEEGVLLNRMIMGSETAATDVNALVSRLARREAAALATEIEGRLSFMQNRFKMVTALEAGADAEGFLRRLSSEVLELQATEGRMAFAGGVDAHTLSVEREAFRAGEHPGRMAGSDLSGRNLMGGELMGADLRFADMRNLQATGANMERAQLLRADLSGARVTEVNLNRAHLSHASLERTNLAGSKLRSSHLEGANLRRANLRGVDLRGADLRGADMTGAIVERSHFRAGYDVQMEGALFDANTKLPFSREEAERMGMIFVD